MRLLVMSGSTRRGSFNTRLADVVRAALPGDGVTVVSNLDALPFYDADLETAGVPSAVIALREAVAASDLLVIATPEYNGTVPGVLGNAVDWLSRPHRRSVLLDKPVVVVSASPSRYGAVRAADHLRAVLRDIGAAVLPVGLSVARAQERLGDDDVDPELVHEMGRVLDQALRRSPTHDGRALTQAA